MEEIKTIFIRIDEYIGQRGYKLITPQPDLDETGDSLFEYISIKSPQKIISAVWNSDRGYFMIQQANRGKINPAMFKIRFKDLRDEVELISDMDYIFNHWGK